MDCLIFDNQLLVRLGLSRLISKSYDKVKITEATTARATLQLLDHQQFDLIITEVEMARDMGLSFIKQMRNKQPEAGILVYSGSNEEAFAFTSIRAGANSFISTIADLPLLTKATQTVLRKSNYLSCKRN